VRMSLVYLIWPLIAASPFSLRSSQQRGLPPCSSVIWRSVSMGGRHLGIFIVRSRGFKCSLDHAKKSLYRASNAIFAKIGRVASEEVTLQLIK